MGENETPNIMYGRLKEAVNISGYSLERAMNEFDWLLDEERWKQVGDGFEDINEFLKTISLSEFKIAAEQRKEISLKLKELQASQRASAEMLGVDQSTVNRDLNDFDANASHDEKVDTDNQDIIINNDANASPEPNWVDEDSQKMVNRQVKSEEKEKKKTERMEAERNIRIDKVSDIDIRLGRFQDILLDISQIDAIITDPPYPKDYLECFSDLSEYASQYLKPDGFCVVYSGQYHLPEVIKRLSENLDYVWTFCLYHVGKKQLVNGVNIMCGWKPVLIFSNGRKKMRFSAYDVLISEKMEKFGHEWQQSESGVASLVEIFTKPGELVVDPFAGSGTFLKVAHEMNRNTIGAEING